MVESIHGFGEMMIGILTDRKRSTNDGVIAFLGVGAVVNGCVLEHATMLSAANLKEGTTRRVGLLFQIKICIP